MSGGPAEVPEIQAPGWLGKPFPEDGGLLEKISDIAGTGGDWTAKGADFASALNLPGMDVIGDPLGGIATAVNQFTNSTVQNPVLRGIEAGIAGGIDVAMGMTPLGPLLPAADSALSAVAGVSPGDLINAGLSGGMTAAESAVTGNKQGVEAFKAKAVTGEYGRVIQWLFGG